MSRQVNPTRKTRTPTNPTVAYLVQRKPLLEQQTLDDLLMELGLLVGQYQINVIRDARYDRASDRAWVAGVREWSIDFEVRRRNRPLFRACKPATTLHEAAVEALLGALAWFGVTSDDDLAAVTGGSR